MHVAFAGSCLTPPLFFCFGFFSSLSLPPPPSASKLLHQTSASMASTFAVVQKPDFVHLDTQTQLFEQRHISDVLATALGLNTVRSLPSPATKQQTSHKAANDPSPLNSTILNPPHTQLRLCESRSPLILHPLFFLYCACLPACLKRNLLPMPPPSFFLLDVLSILGRRQHGPAFHEPALSSCPHAPSTSLSSAASKVNLQLVVVADSQPCRCKPFSSHLCSHPRAHQSRLCPRGERVCIPNAHTGRHTFVCVRRTSKKQKHVC